MSGKQEGLFLIMAVSSSARWFAAALLIVTVALAASCRQGSKQELVVYCAHDSVYAQKVLDAFEVHSGIRVYVKFDSESTKSLGLTDRLKREKDRPRCDVFWNNQLLGTAELKAEGVLEPYKEGAGYRRIPDAYKDPDGYYAGFAARLRIYIINTEKVASDVPIEQHLQNEDLARVAVAKPLYGTTLSHYTVLWDLWGGEKLQAFHHDWRRRGVIECRGNATSMDLVAKGVCDIGWTDTDDYFVAKDRNDPVRMVPIKIDGDRAICIPNTVAIIKGTKNPVMARKLIDFLLSEEVELMLAASPSRQIPLGPVDLSKLSGQVRQLRRWSASGVSLHRLDEARRQCLGWLRKEYLK